MILRFIIPIFLLLSLGMSGQDGNAEVTFNEAGKAYSEGEFEQAIEEYLQVLEMGESAALHFNLGNAYFKSNQVARAILHYERALRIDPSDADVKYNLKLANDRIKDKIEGLPELNISRWWKDFTLSISVDGWAWLSIAFMVVAVLLLLLFFLTSLRSLRVFAFYIALFLLISSAFSYYQAGQAQQLTEADTEAIIMTPRVDVKGAPTQSGVNVFVIHEGTKVRVIREQDGWVNIRIASGNEGWILESDCEII